MSSYANPTVSDFKAYFVRDFPYGVTDDTVMDPDIAKAMVLTDAFINQNLFDSQSVYNIGFLLLSAHFLVLDLQTSAQGVQGKYAWLTQSKGVGNVNEAYAIPQRILDNPEFSMLTKTNYGAQFLFMILPQLSGQIFTVLGWTHP